MRKLIITCILFLLGSLLQAQTDTTVYSFMMVDQKPLWKDCEYEEKYKADSCSDEHLWKFLADNLVYPMHCESIGRVYIQFVIEKDGSKSNLFVRRGVEERLDEEALRVIKLLPNFIPAKLNGITVRCQYILPITFALN